MVKSKKDKAFFINQVDCIPGFEKDLGEPYRAYRKRWDEVNKKRIVTDFPMHIDIELNMTCNYNCVMCPRAVYNIRNEGQVMDAALYRKIIDEGAANGLYSVDFGDLGEALLRPDLAELVRYAKDKGLQDRILHTNGSLLTKERSRELLEAGLTKVQISVDAFTKETYSKVRRGGDYDAVRQNVLDLVEVKKERGLSYPLIRLSFVRMSVNEHEVDDFVKFWCDKVNSISLQDYINPENKQDGSLRPTSSPFKAKRDEKYVCDQLFQRLVIRWDGTVLPCCVDYQNTLALGNVKNQTLKELWHSEKLNNLRRMHLAGESQKIPTCKTCYESHLSS